MLMTMTRDIAGITAALQRLLEGFLPKVDLAGTPAAVGTHAAVQHLVGADAAPIPDDAVLDGALDDRAGADDVLAVVGEEVGPEVVRRGAAVDDLPADRDELEFPAPEGRSPHQLVQAREPVREAGHEATRQQADPDVPERAEVAVPFP